MLLLEFEFYEQDKFVASEILKCDSEQHGIDNIREIILLRPYIEEVDGFMMKLPGCGYYLHKELAEGITPPVTLLEQMFEQAKTQKMEFVEVSESEMEQIKNNQ